MIRCCSLYFRVGITCKHVSGLLLAGLCNSEFVGVRSNSNGHPVLSRGIAQFQRCFPVLGHAQGRPLLATSVLRVYQQARKSKAWGHGEMNPFPSVWEVQPECRGPLVLNTIRVSSPKGQKTDSQRAELEAWLKRHRSKTVRWFEDRESATTLQRDTFQKLQAAIFAGKIDTVVVWKLDRLARNLKEGVNVLADGASAVSA